MHAGPDTGLVPITVSWLDESDRRLVGCEALTNVLAEATATATEPAIVVLEASGAELHLVIGDPTGTVVLYYAVGCTNSIFTPRLRIRGAVRRGGRAG